MFLTSITGKHEFAGYILDYKASANVASVSICKLENEKSLRRIAYLEINDLLIKNGVLKQLLSQAVVIIGKAKKELHND